MTWTWPRLAGSALAVFALVATAAFAVLSVRGGEPTPTTDVLPPPVAGAAIVPSTVPPPALPASPVGAVPDATTPRAVVVRDEPDASAAPGHVVTRDRAAPAPRTPDRIDKPGRGGGADAKNDDGAPGKSGHDGAGHAASGGGENGPGHGKG